MPFVRIMITFTRFTIVYCYWLYNIIVTIHTILPAVMLFIYQRYLNFPRGQTTLNDP